MLPVGVDLGLLVDDGFLPEPPVGEGDEDVRFCLGGVNGSEDSSRLEEAGSDLTGMARLR